MLRRRTKVHLLFLMQFLSFVTSLSASGGTANSILQASQILSKASSVLVVTGAGISAESGLPTYRGVSGLYNEGTSTEDEGMTIEECLSGATYRNRPDLTWKYLLQIEKACRGAEPSRAHHLVARLEDYIQPTHGAVTVMTQNVDGLHTRAGSSDVLCLHGELYKLHCTGDCQSEFEVESYAVFEKEGTFPPLCKKCGGAIRPSVVLFDEYLGDKTVQMYEKMLGEPMSTLMWTMAPKVRRYDVSISIGTSALFPYVNAAALSGKQTIEINPMRTPLSSLVDVRIQAGATDALQAMYDQLGWKA